VYSSSASLLVHVIEMFIFLAYLYFVLKIDFGSNTGFVLLTTFVGSLCGLSFGAFISALVKKSESIKLGIIIGVTMFFSFLAGMMYQGMKYIIAQHAPILSYLNPLNLLTDAFYSLYYYDTYTRYELNMFLLLAFIVIFSSVTYILLRRRKYASI
jgi:ABC-2 type transport system permease protein